MPEGTGITEQTGSEQIPDASAQPSDVNVVNKLDLQYPFGTEGIDYNVYSGNATHLVVRYEVTYGDILTCTLLAFLIIVFLIQFFHKIIFDRRDR